MAAITSECLAGCKEFTAKERDAETNLDYFGARYYRAQSGRFTTVDPVLNTEAALTDPQRWNRYAYATNRPLAMVDPDGREAGYVYLKNGRVLSPYDSGFPRSDRPIRDTSMLAGLFVAGGSVAGVLGSSIASSLAIEAQMAIARVSLWAAGGTAISEAMNSSNPAVRFEGETAAFLAERNLLRGFNVNIGGRQIDAIAGATKSFVIEMTTGRGGGKLAQAAAQMKATGLDVIIYGNNLANGFVKEALSQGFRVARTPQELEQILRF